jgi:metal-responsive CopG/Arc/MetJ family transcriptional regulator
MRKTDWGRRAGNVRRTSIVLPDALWTRVKHRALEEKRNAQEIVADALEDYLRKAKKGGA